MIFNNATCQLKNNDRMKEQNNPLLCDPVNGMCEMPESKKDTLYNKGAKPAVKPVRVIYYTDPICSSCWGIEPQLRKLKLEYGNSIELEYRMGGLLPDWSYNSGGISKPSDVARHWDEVSAYYDMPIDGDVWLEDPLSSSYPPSIAFKAAQMQDQEKALIFLREIREMVFMQKRNISRWEHLESAAKHSGLDIIQFKNDYEGKAKELFADDLESGREAGVRGFPTLFFTDTTGKTEIVYGTKPYTAFQHAVLKLYPDISHDNYEKSPGFIFSKYRTLTAREFSELTGMARNESEDFLNDLTEKGGLKRLTIKNGSIWKMNTPAGHKD